MSHTLMAILGSMLVDGHLRKGLLSKTRSERTALLKQRGFFLSRGEVEVYERMMNSFESGALDDMCVSIESECPKWPCSFFTIAE
jgi:hypothetical protein